MNVARGHSSDDKHVVRHERNDGKIMSDNRLAISTCMNEVNSNT